MSATDFRVLEATEKGMQRHALVPASLIASIANLRHGGTGKILSSLLRDKLLSHDQSCGYDGYRVTQAGYDILALHSLKSRKLIAALGDRIGTGKESDIYLGVQPNGHQVVLKFHRLGRTSFRNVKKTRDYFVYHQKGRNVGQQVQNQANSWLFLSRKSALKEFAFMKALYNVEYPTPEPIAHNRHVVVMSLIRGVPLYQVQSRHLSAEQAASIFRQASDLALRLAKHGLVHCDLNEFNLIVDLSGIQQHTLSNEHDNYVRHSGMSVAAESNPGMLSARGPWEPEHLQKFQPDYIAENNEAASTEEPPRPVELLDNGEAKPIVTLIDFPQMVSTKHPNAGELYERDTACLYKFFTHKLQFQIPEAEKAGLFLTWESVQNVLQEHQQQTLEGAIPEEMDESQSVCLASKAQLRLDQELKASGYSDDYVVNGETELKYHRDGDDSNSEESDAEGNSEEENDNHSLDGSIDNEESNLEDGATMTSSVNIVPTEQLADMTRQQLQEQARERVKQQLEAKKKKDRQRGAFRKRNSNKSYIKGKRVFNDLGM
jgi:RIO kinase 2